MKPAETDSTITLNYYTYPLVVGNSSKYTFEDWETGGSTVQLKAVVQGGRFSEQDVSWTSQDPETAEVNDGLVRARTTGCTRISATLPDGEQAICHICVIDNITRSTVQRLELNTTYLELTPGKLRKGNSIFGRYGMYLCHFHIWRREQIHNPYGIQAGNKSFRNSSEQEQTVALYE